MIRLTSWIVLIMTATASLTGGVIAFSQTRRELDLFAYLGLERCDETLCYKNIRPGVTTWDEVRVILSADSLNETRNYDGSSVISFSDSGTQISVTSTEDGQYVLQVEMTPEVFPITLGKLVRYMGIPCAVSQKGSVNSILQVNYRNLLAEVDINRGHADPESYVYRLFMVQLDSPDLCSQLKKGTPYQWLGFSSLGHYAKAGFPVR